MLSAHAVYGKSAHVYDLQSKQTCYQYTTPNRPNTLPGSKVRFFDRVINIITILDTSLFHNLLYVTAHFSVLLASTSRQTLAVSFSSSVPER